VNKSGGVKHEMFLRYDDTFEDNILFLQERPSDFAATFVQSFNRFRGIGNKGKNYDKMAQSFVVLNKSESLGPEVELDNTTGITGATHTALWVGNATHRDIKVTLNSGTLPVITITDVTPLTVVFSIVGGTYDLRIVVRGSRWSGTQPAAQGEFIDFANMAAGKGNTIKIINVLLENDTEAHDSAKGLIEDNAKPRRQARGVVFPYLNLLPEINDMNLLWTRWVFLDDLFYLTGIRHKWNRARIPIQTTTFNYTDSGLNFKDEGDIIYSRQKGPTHGTAIKYGNGFLYSMGFSPQQDPDLIDTSKYEKFNVGYF